MIRLSAGLVIFSIILYNGLFCVSAFDAAAAENSAGDKVSTNGRDNLGEVLAIRGLEFTSVELGNPFSSAHESRTENMSRAVEFNLLPAKEADKAAVSGQPAAIDSTELINVPRYIGTVGLEGERPAAIIAFGERDYFVTVGDRFTVTLGKSAADYEVLRIEDQSVSLLSPAGEIRLTRQRL